MIKAHCCKSDCGKSKGLCAEVKNKSDEHDGSLYLTSYSKSSLFLSRLFVDSGALSFPLLC